MWGRRAGAGPGAGGAAGGAGGSGPRGALWTGWAGCINGSSSTEWARRSASGSSGKRLGCVRGGSSACVRAWPRTPSAPRTVPQPTTSPLLLHPLAAGQCPNSADLPPGAHATAAHVAGLVEHTRQAFRAGARAARQPAHTVFCASSFAATLPCTPPSRAGLEHSLLAYDDLERALDTAGQQYGAMADASEALAERLRTSGLRVRARSKRRHS